MSSSTSSQPQSEPPSKVDPDALRHQNPPYVVQIGKGRSVYRTHWTFESFAVAFRWYSGLNVHSGHKKRLVNGKGQVITRCLT